MTTPYRPARFPEHPDLDQLRRQARELQRRVRAGDHAESGGLGGEGPDFPLARAQLALAMSYGFPSWPRLRQHVDAIGARSWSPPDTPARESEVDRLVRLACLSYSATDTHPDRPATADELRAGPELATTSLAAAVVLGDVGAVRARLDADASSASVPTGPRHWSPLMYLAYARVEGADALGVATLLLDRGADPNDGRFFAGLATPFTVLTGVLGGGERGESAHPQTIPLARLLLERGADANDAQALYNLQFDEDDTALELLFEFGLGHGHGGPWRRLLPDLLVAPRRLLRRLLRWAVVHDQRARVAMLAAHGVDVISPLGSVTPIALALASGHTELADRLRELGADEPDLDPTERFVAAAVTGDRAAVAATPQRVVAQVRQQRPGLMVWAAAQGRPAAVTLLVEAGFDIDALGRGDVPVEQPWQTALHSAVERGDPALVSTLLALGASRTVHDLRFDSTPLQWADHLGHEAIAALLADEAPSDPDR